MDAHFSHRKQTLGLLFGLIAGFAFAITAWGVDAVMIARAHAVSPFAKFLPGLVICTLAGGLVGWLSIRLEKAKIAIFLWLGLAGLFTWLVMWLPLHFLPTMLKTFDPGYGKLLTYVPLEGEGQVWGMAFVVIGFVSFLCGLLEIHLIDQALLSEGGISIFIPLIVSLGLLAFAGITADGLLNRSFREPIQAMDELIQFAVDNEGKEVPALTAREKRLSVVKEMADLIDRPRRLAVIGFDETLWQMKVLVDFDGELATCTVMVNQPTMCVRSH